MIAGIEGAARFMLEADLAEVAAAETDLLTALQSGLEDLDGVTVHGPPPGPDRAPTVIFSVRGRRPAQVAEELARRRIAVWSGDNYACELIDALGLRESGGAVRAGLVRYSTPQDVAALVDAVTELARRRT